MLQKLILLIFALLILGSNSQCTSYPSALNYMVTGVVEMGSPIDTIAKDDYNVLFSGTQTLGTYANIFSAFSIIGMQTSSNQNFYSLTVDQIYLSNSNTVMKFTMDYFNNDRSVKSQWNKVKLAYILVSPQFGGMTTGAYGSLAGNSYVWASSYQYNLTTTGGISNQAIASDPLFSNSNNGICGYIDTFPKSFGTDCPADSKILYHYYIMGFKYDSTIDNVYEFRVSVRGGDGLNTNENTFSVVIGNGVTPNGPKYTIQSQNGYLKSIKIGVVITVIRDYATYPSQLSNPQKFKYSGIYMPVTTYNSQITILSSNLQNLNKFDIGNVKYMFYGFSSIAVQPNSYVDISLDVSSLYNLQVKSQNMLNNVIVSADFYSPVLNGVCSSAITQRNQIRSQQYTGSPSLAAMQQTFTKVSASSGILTDATNQYVFQVYGYKYGDNQDTIIMTAQLTYEGLSPGKAHMLEIGFDELSSSGLPNGWNIKYTLGVDNSNIFTDTIAVDSTLNNKITKIGRTISSTTSTINITIGFMRNPSQDIHFKINFAMFEISNVYDSVNQCCALTCPVGSSISVKSNPYTCVSCNSTAGQFYNPNTAQCQCSQGYYLLSQANQVCVSCPGQLCAACNPSNPAICLTCMSGATLQFPGQCYCNSGLVAVNNSCSSCSYKCSSCDSTGRCLTCSDSKRDITNNCNCPDGFYDNLQSSCLACGSGCKTCSGQNVCLTCDLAQNKILSAGSCVCNSGYFPTVDGQGNIFCNKCAPQCDNCQYNAYTCTFCDSTKNKVAGYDSTGRLTCVCTAGYFIGADGTCSQTDCTTDPYCQQCSTDSLKICLSCKPSLNRTLDTSSYKCVCQDGFYEGQNGQCVTCSNACASCTNSTYCKTCVAGSIRSGNTCSCPNGTYFTDQPTRYCKGCQQSCTLCNTNRACLQCLPNYQLTSDGKCICGPGKFTTSSGECTTCASPQCLTCKNSTYCLTCISGYLLQEGKCISACSQGYYRNGTNCLTCSSGCNFCSGANGCLACNIGVYLYNGKCYSSCPAGSIIEQSSGKCVPCNSPCKTCSVHPSICTSCEVNAALSDGKCVSSCGSGTYSVNGLCQSCDFNCATCMGSARYCTSCPQAQFLYNGACYDYCPRYDSSGKCLAQCSAGFYQSSNSGCLQCSQNCSQCSSATKCTICAGGYFSYLGDCINSCPVNTYIGQNNDCIQCDKTCSSCQSSPTNCTQCASGYVRDSRTNLCVLSQQSQCTANCQVCMNNVCSQCSYGYFLTNNNCVANCPYPLSAINGQCRCSTGILYNGNCVTSCPSGFTVINSVCTKCDSNCQQCSEQVNYCTSCTSVNQLNAVTKKCQPITTNTSKDCPYGQYLADSGECKKYCLNGLFYLNGLCYYTCVNNLVDNGFGGCVVKSQTLQCSSGQFLMNGNCLTLCPVGYFGNTVSKACESCAANCNQCSSSQKCTLCTSSYILNSQGQCTLKPVSLCSPGLYELNSNCFSNCPMTYFANSINSKCESCPSNCNQCTDASTCTICSLNYYLNSQGGCSTKSSICQSGLFELNGYCFNICPVGYFSNSQSNKCESCQENCTQCSNSTVCTVCASPLILSSGKCIQQSTPSQPQPQTCNSGFYLNQNQNLCYPCKSPCSTCSNQTNCLTCTNGYSLSNGQCISTACSDGYYKDSTTPYCLTCQSPCLTCTSASSCNSCVNGYQLISNGSCMVIQSNTNLVQLTGITVEASYKRGNSVIISLVLPKMPSSLTQQQRNKFFIVKQSNAVNTIVSVTQWVPDILARRVFVMVNFASIDGSSFLFLSVSNSVMGSAYAEIGYSVNEKGYKAVSVYQSMNDAPVSIQVPVSAMAVPYVS